MKISILITQDGKQVMMTPENDHEKAALKLIAPGDKMEVATKFGTYTNKKETLGYEVDLSQGGYFRAWESKESLMFIIKNQAKEEQQ